MAMRRFRAHSQLSASSRTNKEHLPSLLSRGRDVSSLGEFFPPTTHSNICTLGHKYRDTAVGFSRQRAAREMHCSLASASITSAVLSSLKGSSPHGWGCQGSKALTSAQNFSGFFWKRTDKYIKKTNLKAKNCLNQQPPNRLFSETYASPRGK